MNEDLLTPGVPALSDEWVTERTQYLVEEIATPSLRQKRSYVLGGVGGGVVAGAAALVGLLGPWASPAFAGWSAQPTSASSGQVSTAQTACASLAANLANSPGSTASATLPPVSLTDARGPYTLIVYGTTSPTLCVLGNGFSSLNENGGTIGTSDAPSMGGGTTVVGRSTTERVSMKQWAAAASAPGEATVEYENSAVNSNGWEFSVVEGSIGSRVSEVTLTLSDGSSVVATVDNGIFAAWWPSQATVSLIQATTTSSGN